MRFHGWKFDCNHCNRRAAIAVLMVAAAASVIGIPVSWELGDQKRSSAKPDIASPLPARPAWVLAVAHVTSHVTLADPADREVIGDSLKDRQCRGTIRAQLLRGD